MPLLSGSEMLEDSADWTFDGPFLLTASSLLLLL
jgi:hypothetical protein